MRYDKGIYVMNKMCDRNGQNAKISVLTICTTSICHKNECNDSEKR